MNRPSDCGGLHRACPDGEPDWQDDLLISLVHLPHKAAGVHGRAHAAFTLIEVLSVVGIILLLAGLLFPAAQLVRESARRRQAQQQAQSLVQAIKQYRNTYGTWPGQTNDSTDPCSTNYPDLLRALTNNPRNIVFLSFPDSLLIDGACLDPWRRPFIIAVDGNHNGVSELVFPTGGSTNVADAVAVASWGPDPENPDKRVYSWARR